MTNTASDDKAASSRANGLEDAGDIEGAIQAMSEAIRLAPEKAAYRALRGRLFTLVEKWRAAIRDFDDALALKPNHPTWHFGRGRARFMIDDLDGAIADFERCIALEPDAADAWGQIGDIYRYRWDWEQAIRAYERAIELEHKEAENLADLLLQMKEQIWRRDNGQLAPSPPQTARYSPPCHDPERIRMRDELHEIQQGRRDAVVPYQRKRLQSDDPES
jgi:tetratricopeptide (TPR) repeat protein